MDLHWNWPDVPSCSGSAPAASRRRARLAGCSTEREKRHTIGPRDELALPPGADANDQVRLELPALALGDECRVTAEDHVHLFVVVRRVIVSRIVLPVRRELQDVHAPLRDAEALAGVEETPLPLVA